MSPATTQEQEQLDMAAIDNLASLIQSGFQNPEKIRGTVKVHVPELPQRQFHRAL